MQRIEQALARHRTYAVLGGIVADGVPPGSEPIIAAMPHLGEVLLDDAEARAVEHQRVFGFEVPPYESAFLERSGTLGGDRSAAVTRFGQACGFRSGRTDLEPDHLALELALLAHLCLAEHDALEDGHTEVADQLAALQQRFLGEHLLQWLPAVALAVGAVTSGLEARVVELALELCASHAAPVTLPLSPDEAVLADPRTGLRDIGAYLAAPARSGVFLSQAVIARIAAGADVPSGFGPRVRRLESVLFAAADHQRLALLCEAIDQQVEDWCAGYEAVGALGVDVAPWIERAQRTQGVLHTLAEVTS